MVDVAHICTLVRSCWRHIDTLRHQCLFNDIEFGLDWFFCFWPAVNKFMGIWGVVSVVGSYCCCCIAVVCLSQLVYLTILIAWKSKEKKTKNRSASNRVRFLCVKKWAHLLKMSTKLSCHNSHSAVSVTVFKHVCILNLYCSEFIECFIHFIWKNAIKLTFRFILNVLILNIYEENWKSWNDINIGAVLKWQNFNEVFSFII